TGLTWPRVSAAVRGATFSTSSGRGFKDSPHTGSPLQTPSCRLYMQPPGETKGEPMPRSRRLASASDPARRRVGGVLLLAVLLLSGLALAPRAGAAVYWGNSLGGVTGLGTTIGRANNDGTGVNQAFIRGASVPTAVAVDAAHVYWINEMDRSIGRANLDGTGANQRFITDFITPPIGLAVDRDHI